jgi:hypothetical protein
MAAQVRPHPFDRRRPGGQRGLAGVPARVDQGLDRLAGMAVRGVEGRDRRAIGDGADVDDPLGLPHPRRGLDDPGLAGVGHQERRPVRPLLADVARAALAVPLEERRDDLDGAGRRRAPLEPEAHQVHAGERRRVRARILRRVDRLVADGDAGLVDAVLEPPHPPRPRPDEADRLVDAGVDLDVRRPDRLGPPCALEALEHLRLTRRPIGVLGEQRGAGGRRRGEGDEAVTHQAPNGGRAGASETEQPPSDHHRIRSPPSRTAPRTACARAYGGAATGTGGRDHSRGGGRSRPRLWKPQARRPLSWAVSPPAR